MALVMGMALGNVGCLGNVGGLCHMNVFRIGCGFGNAGCFRNLNGFEKVGGF